jgi:hypothetical protein
MNWRRSTGQHALAHRPSPGWAAIKAVWGGAWCATLNLDADMITLANRATPRPLTLEQQENAMTSEGAPPLGQMPESLPSTTPKRTDLCKRVPRGGLYASAHVPPV